jgi:succinate dehydrogenase / fumarate reductase flavoprotein subunit
MKLDPKIPEGNLADKWTNQKFNYKLVNPSNRKKYKILIVGTGLAGASAAASLGELGYNVEIFTYNDSPRRAHSVAAQGGINAAKNYKNDGDSIYRLFFDTIKGGDFRAREANVYRLAEVSNNIIDQCVAQGVPFAREYGGLLANRSFGGAQVSRTFFAKGQTGQQLLLGAYSALSRQIHEGTVKLHTRKSMLELVLDKRGRATGIVTRDQVNGEIEKFSADAVVIATGGYGNVFYLSTNAKGSNGSAAWAAYKKGAGFANPSFTQIHPTCIPQSADHQSKLTLMSESLRNDGRIWVPTDPNEKRNPRDIPENERDYFLERKYPAFGNLVPRDIAARAIKEACDKGLGVAKTGNGVYLDFADAINNLGRDTIEARYGNLFEMYELITGVNPYENPMQIYPASHYTMGGLWVDYNLMSNIEGLFVIGEANFSDHGANRLGASALMQGLSDGYFVLPYSLADYIARAGKTDNQTKDKNFSEAETALKAKIEKLMKVGAKGTQTPDLLHRKLGKIVWNKCGMARNKNGLSEALTEIQSVKKEFWSDVKITGSEADMNYTLEQAIRTADFIEIAELMVRDALSREESAGSHYREEYKTQEGEAMRRDDEYTHVAVWEYQGEDKEPVRHREELNFENVELTVRSYK